MTMTKSLLKAAWARLNEANSIALACHQNPDGDTLGSALALAHVLRLRDKDVVVLCEDSIPENYHFVPEYELVVSSTDGRDFDIGMLIDCDGTKRVGAVADVIESAKTGGCIDHHVPESEFGEIRVSDHDASSTAELMLDFLEANDVQIDQAVATQLMTGIVNDTGAFRFPNTAPSTFRAAARLTELGADASMITRRVYECKPLRAMKLLGRALNGLQTDASGKIVWATITRADMDDLGATDADTDSVVNHVGWVKGPGVAILLRETKPDSIRISLRSRNGVDVNLVARAFGGGGHAAAAGCTIEASLDEAVKMVVGEVSKWMES